MTEKAEQGLRANQRLRTRKALLQAATRLMQEGRKPTLEEVAAEALVSRATAYRYFSGTEALLAEAVVDVAVPNAKALFGDDSPGDPISRLAMVDSALSKAIAENEIPLRLMLAYSLQQRVEDFGKERLPVRQNRRTPLIEAALEPAKKDFRNSDIAKLKSALALILGTEAAVVFRDVLQMDDAKASEVRRWAISALVDAAKR